MKVYFARPPRLRPRRAIGTPHIWRFVFAYILIEHLRRVGLKGTELAQARTVIAEISEAYHTIRLHSSLSFLRPADYYRGDPETPPAERRRRLQAARELRKQENIKLRQRLIPWPDDKTTPYPERQIVSL